MGVHWRLWRLLKENIIPFWEQLKAFKGSWEEPWCIGDDFDVIRLPRERSSLRRLNASMRSFLEVLDDFDLVDLPFLGVLSHRLGVCKTSRKLD